MRLDFWVIGLWRQLVRRTLVPRNPNEKRFDAFTRRTGTGLRTRLRRLQHGTSCATANVMILENRRMLAAAPVGDLTEGNAASWSTFANDGKPASVTNDTTHVRAGLQSLQFDTQSGFDTGIRLTAPAGGWDLTTRNLIEFWAFGDNQNQFGWQGNQPVIVINSASGSLTLMPTKQLMSNHSWVKIHAPFSGDETFQATSAGGFDLSHVTSVEIHQDTWDYGFRVYYDGVQFAQRAPSDLPAAGPPAPAGVNPDAISPRVLLYVFDPVMENMGGQRQHAAYGWSDGVTLAQQTAAAIQTSSHSLVNYQFVTQVVDQHPYFDDGFQHTDASFATAWAARDFHGSAHFDYVRFANENHIAARIDSGEIDEVWIYTGPISGTWESCMGGESAYWINGPTQPISSHRAFPIMGLNFERGVAEALHSFGHRVESTLDHIYAPQGNHLNNNWDKFTFQDRYQAGLGGIGSIHFPVNGTSDYDYGNLTFVLSNADDWYNYPNFQGLKRSINAHEWAPVGVDPHFGYMKWWYDHIPHFASRGPDFRLNNWWRYIVDIDQFKTGNPSLSLTDGQPVVKVITPTTISTAVDLSADAFVDGALGRVDFYLDGVYQQTDGLSPFTFHLDASTLSLGNHIVSMKAYDLQNQTEGVSVPVTVNVATVNDAPVGTSNTVTALKNSVFKFATTDFGFTDPADSPANAFAAVKITTLPTAGTLTNNGISVKPGQFVSVSDISSGRLVFTPATNASGLAYSSFTFQVQDNGGTANGGVDLDPVAKNMKINVILGTSLSGSILTVSGSSADDIISVTEGAQLVITVNGATSTYAPASVTAIVIYGNAGKDSITVNSLNVGTAFVADGGEGNDTILVNAAVVAATSLLGGNGNDVLTGGSGHDRLDGGTGTNILAGGVGNDSYILTQRAVAGSDKDSLIDPSGTDGISFANFTHDVKFNLQTIGAQVVDALTGYRVDFNGGTFEIVYLGSGNDVVIGNAAVGTTLDGGAGNDTLTGGTGNDRLVGGAGNDRLAGGTGTNVLLGGNDNDSYILSARTVVGTDKDTLADSSGTDGISMVAFSKSLILNLSTIGAQTVDATTGYQMDLTGGTFETVYLGSGNDIVTGNATIGTTLDGGVGNDTLTGGTGNDRLVGGAGNDRLVGGTGTNILLGGDDNDSYILSARTVVGTDKDTLGDSSGTDGISMVAFTHTLTFNLSTIGAQTVDASTGYRVDFTGGTFETVYLGSGNDIVTGNATVGTTIHGGTGNNILIGGTGNDTLIGGAGRDILIGNAGLDAFNAGVAEDLLIGGFFSFSTNTNALNAVRNEWTSATSYQSRIDHLRGTVSGGLNTIAGGSSADFFLTATTVTDDLVKDKLTGGGDNDWFWVFGLDSTDKSSGEFTN